MIIPPDLLQSDGWERFQRAIGRRTHRIDGVLCIRMPLPFGGTYLYSPRSGELTVESGGLSNRIASIAHDVGAIFWRRESESEPSTVHHPPSTPLVLRRAVEPEWTWRTSLAGSEDELLARMHEKHRYNVRLAAKRGVVVRSSKLEARSSKDIDSFWTLLQDTAKRQEIKTHPRRYYEIMLRELPQTSLYSAEHTGVAIACAIVAYHGDTATYLHGGSSYEHRALMAPHLLHWQAMRDARDAGMRWYDWGGVQPDISHFTFQISSSCWSGMTRFKIGFGGETVHHQPTRDLVFHPGWYRMLAWMTQLRG